MRPYYVWGEFVYRGTMGKQAEATTFTVAGD